MKKLIIILFSLILSSCISHIAEYGIVRTVTSTDLYNKKYRIDLDIKFNGPIFLYTNNNIYKPGDTLYFNKRK